MISPKWNDLDPGFVAMSQAFTLHLYRDAPFVPQRLMSPPVSYPEPLSPCLCADTKPKAVSEQQSVHELHPKHEDQGESGYESEHEKKPNHEFQHEPEHETEQQSESSSPQKVKHEIAWSTIEAGLQGFASVRPSTSSSSNGYIDEFGCAYYSDAGNTAETIQSFPYPFNATYNSQSHLPIVGDVTVGADGHITTQVAGHSGTAGYFSVFPTTYQPQSYQLSYDAEYFGTAASGTASFGGPNYDATSHGAASYGNASYGNNAYANAYISNPYSTTAYDLAPIQGMTGSQMGMEYPHQYKPYGESALMTLSASLPTPTMHASMPASTMVGVTITTPTKGLASNRPATPDCSLNHLHPSEKILPGSPLRGDRPRRGTTFYRYVTPPFRTAGAPHYVLGEEQPTTAKVGHRHQGHSRGLSRDSDSGRSSSSRSSSSSSSDASTAGYHRQTILDSIPPHKLQAMQNIPLPPEGDNLAKDQYIVKGKQLKLSYGQIKAIANWPDAESTLRGRYRNFTKAKHERVRKPVWHEIDKRLLIRVVMKYARDNLDRMPAGGRGGVTGHRPGMRYTVQTLPEGTEANIPWRDVAKRMVAWGGTYEFGASTTKRKWFELTRRKRTF